MLAKQRLQQLRGRLIKMEQELKDKELENKYDLERSHFHDATGDLSSYDNHPADEGTELFEREKDLALYEHDRLEMKDIHLALEAMDEGTYGFCEVCHKEIPAARLEALPATRYCREDSPSRHIPSGRPVEEDVIIPELVIKDADQKTESVIYDTEDAWQEVARYGTSETPADFAGAPGDYEDMYIESEENIGYVEVYENFAAVDLYGNPVPIYPSTEHELYEEILDEESIQSPFGDLPASEKEPYTEE